MSMTRPRRPRARSGLALAATLVVSLLTVAPTSADPPTDGTSQTVRGISVDPSRLRPAPARPTAREAANAKVTTPRHHPRPGQRAASEGLSLTSRPTSAPKSSSRPPRTGTTTAPAGPSIAAVSEGFSAFTFQPATGVGADPANVNAAIVGSAFLAMTRGRLYASSLTTHLGTYNWTPDAFFALPYDEYYWGASVASSTYRGRFVAVLPSFDDQVKGCAHGWLNVAVSSTGNPVDTWTRFRIPISGAYTDQVGIGVSDDKVVLTANEWSLDAGQPDCIGSTYVGARVRVIDWTDLIDKGTLTVRDVSPAPRTGYYSWVAASNVPGTSSTAAGTTVQLVGDANIGGWGHLVHTTLTGSAKAGTAKIGAVTDLSTAASVRLLIGPPATIAAFPSGNGFQDERVVSAAWRSGRLWLSTNDACRLDPDPDYRACARFVGLDTSTSPATVVEDATFVEVERDTFLPLVGLSRSGTAYFTMSGSSAMAHETIAQYGTYRAAGQSIGGGPSEVKFQLGGPLLSSPFWGDVGSVVHDPGDPGAVWAVYPTIATGYGSDGFATKLKGGLTGDPGGSMTMGNGTGWTGGPNTMLYLSPDPESPIQWARYSASPDTVDDGDGPRLVNGRDAAAEPLTWNGINLADPSLGGPATGDSFTAWVQWRTEDGRWSTPISATLQVDDVPPTMTGPFLAFAPGTVGTTAPVRISWTGADVPSGVKSISLSVQRSQPHSNVMYWYPPGTTSALKKLTVKGRYLIFVQVLDQAELGAGADAGYATISATKPTSKGLSLGGSWATQTSSNFLGGSTRYSSSKGARFSYAFTGRAVAFVSTKGRDRGKAEIYVDGVKVTTINLYSSSTKYRQVVWQTSWPTAGAHTVKVRVVGTGSRRRIDADAFLKI